MKKKMYSSSKGYQTAFPKSKGCAAYTAKNVSIRKAASSSNDKNLGRLHKGKVTNGVKKKGKQIY